METSCIKNTNVSDAFETLIEITNREAIKNKNNNKKENNPENDSITITKNNNSKNDSKKSCSC